MAEFRDLHDATVICTGNQTPRQLSIPGIKSRLVIDSKRFTGWINGSPNDRMDLDFSQIKNVLVIGNGNVALDVTRILVRGYETLRSSDISSKALSALKNCSLNNVYIVGRRGPESCSFTTKELRDLKSSNADFLVEPGSLNFESHDVPRSKLRTLDCLKQLSMAKECASTPGTTSVHFLFNRNLVKLEARKTGHGLEAYFMHQSNGLDALNEIDLVITCLGYQNISSTFDLELGPKGEFTNVNGLVSDKNEDLFVAGWSALGSTGAIAETLSNSKQVADSLLTKNINRNCSLKKVEIPAISWTDWLYLSSVETFEGAWRSKVNEKIPNCDIAKSLLDLRKKIID